MEQLDLRKKHFTKFGATEKSVRFVSRRELLLVLLPVEAPDSSQDMFERHPLKVGFATPFQQEGGSLNEGRDSSLELEIT